MGMHCESSTQLGPAGQMRHRVGEEAPELEHLYTDAALRQSNCLAQIFGDRRALAPVLPSLFVVGSWIRVVEGGRSVACQAGGQLRHRPFPGRAGEVACVGSGDRGFPVGGGCSSFLADEAGEFVVVQPGCLGDDRPGGGFERAESGGSGGAVMRLLRWVSGLVAGGVPSAGSRRNLSSVKDTSSMRMLGWWPGFWMPWLARNVVRARRRSRCGGTCRSWRACGSGRLSAGRTG